MKNENKIVELLAETLKKQDRHEEILGIHGKLLEQLVKGQEALVKGQEELVNGQELLVEGQKALIQEFHKMNDHLLSRQDKMEDRISSWKIRSLRVNKYHFVTVFPNNNQA